MSDLALAKKMHIRRENVYKMRRRYPLLQQWIAETIVAANADLIGPVLRKMALVALRGSVDHARVFLQASGKLGPDADPGAGRGVAVFINGIPEPAPAEKWVGGMLEAPKGA